MAFPDAADIMSHNLIHGEIWLPVLRQRLGINSRHGMATSYMRGTDCFEVGFFGFMRESDDAVPPLVDGYTPQIMMEGQYSPLVRFSILKHEDGSETIQVVENGIGPSLE